MPNILAFRIPDMSDFLGFGVPNAIWHLTHLIGMLLHMIFFPPMLSLQFRGGGDFLSFLRLCFVYICICFNVVRIFFIFKFGFVKFGFHNSFLIND